ncbi:MAG: DNA recombination protein RmuC [Candidatus Levybacteria bacterium]|nr:DNA recombination protein RmuC [Candidatus Levybacteria bacterium]
MNIELFLGIIILLILIGFVFIYKKITNIQKDNTNAALLEWLKSMQKTVDTSSSHMINTLQENSKQLNDRLDRTAAVIKDVSKEVGQMSEIGRSMKELQDFLKSPKLRGNIGEQVLNDLISQMFPKNSFNLQYQFRSGDKVDVAIKTDAGILCIDSKFPMENFQKMTKASIETRELFQKDFTRDVKKHIDAISKKYILPEEGTMDFSLMYVPSESVYYEIVNMTDIMEHARKSRIYIVSPSTLYAHLQTILLSFEGRKIEQRSHEVLKIIRGLQIDYGKVDENMSILGRHLTNAHSQFNNVNTGFSQLGQKISNANILGDKEEDEKLKTILK